MRKFVVNVNGASYDVEVEEVSGGAKQSSVVEADTRPAVSAQKAETPKAVAMPATSGKGSKLLSPMPGMILSFKVANGATVKKGQAVLVLEAMKMENEIAANADGVIAFVAVKGASVNSGDVLATIS